MASMGTAIPTTRPASAIAAKQAWLIFAIALVARYGYLALVYAGPASLRVDDSSIYEALAAQFAAGCALHLDCTSISWAVRMPGYPIFLAAIRLVAGGSPLWPVLAQGAIDGASCVLIAWLAGLLDRRLALPAGILAALNLNMIANAELILTDSLFMPFLIGMTIAVLLYFETPSLRRAFAAGLLLGLGLVIRSSLLFYLPVVLAALAIAAQRRQVAMVRIAGHLAVAAAMAMLCIAPVLVRNMVNYHRVALVAQGGQHVMLWVAPAAREFARGEPFDDGVRDMKDRYQARLAREPLAAPADPFEEADAMTAVGREALDELGIAGIAKAWIAGTAINLGAPALISVPPVANLSRPHFYDTPGRNALDKLRNFAAHSAGSLFFWLMAPAVLWTLLTRLVELAALCRIGRAGGLPLGPSLYLLANAGYFIAITGPVTGVKYRLPLEPLLIVLLASALVWLWQRLRPHRS